MNLRWKLWWRVPQNVKDMGTEAIELASAIMRLSPGPDLGKITEPARQGFASNFATESGGPFLQPWQALAERTRRERQSLGFPPAHPILDRTGSYRRSWTNRTSSNHFEKQSRQRDKVEINLGSVDYRAPIHELGLEMPTHLIQREQMIQRATGMPVMQGSGAIPPRPVRYISDAFADKIGRAIDFLLGSKASKVQQAQ